MQTWRNHLRLSSALVLLGFVICHLTAHCLLLVSFAAADDARDLLMYPWRTGAGTALLLTALLVHYANALWSIYLRRSLRLPPWQWTQIALGLCIPVLLMTHVFGTRIAEGTLDVHNNYKTVLIAQWLVSPWLGVVQVLAVLTVWIHACVGVNFWLRIKRWYPAWRPFFFGFALLLPALALAGFVAAGNEVRRGSENPDYVGQALQGANLTPEKRRQLLQWERRAIAGHFMLVALPFAARGVRSWRNRRRRLPLLSHPSGRTMPVSTGASVLETLRENAVPHAALCGGRARCTTCRVLVTKGLDQLPAASGAEAQALARIGATPGMRLACQIRPTADISVMPLLAADANAAEGRLRGGFEGRERLITVVFVDIRGSTTLAETRLPYDVLFILNRFFQEMTKAIAATNGHYSQFTGDGLMALYGLDATEPATGAAEAVRGARTMLAHLDQLNHQLRGDLPAPLRIGIGIHYGDAIVGAMGPPRSQIITAIGDTVNTCARLEGLTKDYDCLAVVSRRAAEAAGLDVAGCELHQASVKGRNEPVEFYALRSADNLANT
jgi:adenylate cyclase